MKTKFNQRPTENGQGSTVLSSRSDILSSEGHLSRVAHLSCLLVLLTATFCAGAQGGNGITVSNLAVEAGTVTLNVSWDKNAMPTDFLWSDTVWVWVDYNNAGRMERLPLSAGATLTATSAPGIGKVVEVPGNNSGVWVVGNAKTDPSGSFSATVQLLTETADFPGACAYASNYPPVAEYTDATHLSLKGSPLYKMVIAAGGSTYTAYSDGSYTLSRGHTLQSFTDKTGAPGTMTCKTPDVYELKVSAASFCAGASVTFALSNTTAGKTYRLFRGSNTVSTLSATGGAATFTGAFSGAGIYTAQVDAEGAYCPAAMSGTRVVVENPLPVLTVKDTSRDCAGTVTLTASSPGAVIDWYVAADAASSVYTGASYTTPEIAESTTYYVQARNESTGCLSARAPALAEVITEGCCHAPGVTGVTFAAFTPCSATVGATYTLTDGRDSKTYKVMYLPDDRYWMVQDLAFGEKCETKSSMGNLTTAGNITDSGTYYGDCYKVNLAGAGYGYNYTAAMNYGVTTNGYTCSGTLTGYESSYPATCAGICPANWHIPTSAEWSLMDTKLLASQLCTGTACWRSPDMLNMSQKDLAGEGAAETFIFASDNLAWMYGISNDLHQSYGIQPPCFVRCTKNTP